MARAQYSLVDECHRHGRRYCRVRLPAAVVCLVCGPAEIDAKQVFEGAIQRLVRAAAAVTRHFQNGSLQGYVAWVLAMVAAVLVWQLPELDRVTGERAMLPVDGVSVLCALMLIAAALLTTVLHRQRMMAIISLSVVGLIVSLIFVRFSAPDLTLTQLSVEVVSVLLMMLAMYFLPARAKADSNSLRVGRDVVLAGLIGTGVAVAALLVMTTDTATISPFFLENSVPGGGGTNVVNVILVDFRGFDTFGEITVLGIAALGIYALLSDLKLASAKYDPFGRPWAHDAHPLVLVTLSRPLLPLALMIAVYIFLRGHNLPGGGFVAGLITSGGAAVAVCGVRGDLGAQAHPGGLSPPGRPGRVAGGAYRCGQLGLRFAVPDQHLYPCALAPGRRFRIGQRHVVRYRRVPHRGGRHPADTGQPGQAVAA